MDGRSSKKNEGQDDSLPIESKTLINVSQYIAWEKSLPPDSGLSFREVLGSNAQAAGWVTCLIQEFIDLEEQ